MHYLLQVNIESNGIINLGWKGMLQIYFDPTAKLSVYSSKACQSLAWGAHSFPVSSAEVLKDFLQA